MPLEVRPPAVARGALSHPVGGPPSVAPRAVLGELRVSHLEPLLQLLHLPFECIVVLRLHGRRGQRLAQPGPRAGAAAGAAASATARPVPSASGAASTSIGPRAAGPSRGYRSPAIAAAMATMEGCRVCSQSFRQVVGVGHGDGGGNRQLRLVWAHPVGRRRVASARALRALRVIECGKAVGSWAFRE